MEGEATAAQRLWVGRMAEEGEVGASTEDEEEDEQFCSSKHRGWQAVRVEILI